jgi:hypothetical protein
LPKIDSRSFSKSLASTGNRPQNTTGWTSLKPGSGFAPGRFTSVMVSPTGSGDLLDLRGDEADLAGAQLASCSILGREAADAVHQMRRAAAMNLICWPLVQRRRSRGPG